MQLSDLAIYVAALTERMLILIVVFLTMSPIIESMWVRGKLIAPALLLERGRRRLYCVSRIMDFDGSALPTGLP